MRIYNTALSASEIQAIRAGGTGTACNSGADASGNRAVEMTELMSRIAQWKTGSVTMNSLMSAIDEWKYGC